MERRRAMRRVPASDESLTQVRLRTGRDLAVIDVSNNGVLVDTTLRLLPGTRLEVHVVTHAGRLLIRSRVVRCFVTELRADAVCYRGALAFERPIDTAARAAEPPLSVEIDRDVRDAA